MVKSGQIRPFRRTNSGHYRFIPGQAEEARPSTSLLAAISRDRGLETESQVALIEAVAAYARREIPDYGWGLIVEDVVAVALALGDECDDTDHLGKMLAVPEALPYLCAALGSGRIHPDVLWSAAHRLFYDLSLDGLLDESGALTAEGEAFLIAASAARADVAQLAYDTLRYHIERARQDGEDHRVLANLVRVARDIGSSYAGANVVDLLADVDATA